VPNRQIVRELRVPFWKLPAIARDFRAVMAEHAHEIALFDGVAGFLEAMQAAGVKVAIVSSNSEANIRRILGEENAARVTCYVCAASLFGKARLFRTAVRKTGVTRGRALCVGDETRDIEAARQAGLRCAAVSWGYATRQVLADARPDHLVDSFEELVRLLAR
jgi:phosphoglycolate phosphatase